MKPRLALIIGSILALIFGLLLAILPGQMLAGFGLNASIEAIVVSRDVGVMLLGLALLNWMARNAAPGPALTAILTANLAVQILEIVVNGIELAIGDLPMAAAPGLVIHVAIGTMFALAIWRPDKSF